MNLRVALPVLACVLLAACASGPKKSASEPSALPEDGGIASSQLPGKGGKPSPYAPAQEDVSKRGDYTAGGLYAPHIADSAPGELPDVDAIPEPEVTNEPHSRYGNRASYTVLGKSYKVLDSAKGYDETGTASYYGNKFHGRRTSNLEVYDMYAFTAAHKTLPLPSFARVTNLDNGKSVTVRVNDRGPFHDGRLIDLSFAAAVKLGIHPHGTGRVEVVGLNPGEKFVQDKARNDPGAIAANKPVAIPTGSGALKLPPGVRIATGKPAAVTPTAMDNLVQRLPQSPASTSPATTSVATAPQAATLPGTQDRDWRFDMTQDGKAMTADQFDAWMASRRARVATGKPGTPDPYGAAAPGAARIAAKAARAAAPPASETMLAARAADRAPPPSASAPRSMPAGAGVTLQVAAFGARANAERALNMLRGAGVDGARMLDGVSAGKPVWRVRVGPVDNTKIAELSARVAGLGFGQPQVVRE